MAKIPEARSSVGINAILLSLVSTLAQGTDLIATLLPGAFLWQMQLLEAESSAAGPYAAVAAMEHRSCAMRVRGPVDGDH